MLRKLAIRNAKRSIKDYLVYLITVIMSFSLIIAFNLIVYSKDVRELWPQEFLCRGRES